MAGLMSIVICNSKNDTRNTCSFVIDMLTEGWPCYEFPNGETWLRLETCRDLMLAGF